MESFAAVATQLGPHFAPLSNGSVVDKVTPDMAHLISPYWNQFPAMDPIWAKILTAYMIIIGMISWCGNGVVIYIFATTKSLRTPANLLVINLAISDFGIMITNTPMMGINLYFETWVLGPMMCDIYAGLGSAFGCSSIWSMCMISLDRYQVIVKGMAGRPMTIPLALGKIAYIWFMSSIWCLAPVFGWSRYVPEGNLTSCGIDYLERDWNPRSYLIFYSIFVYYIPLFLICYSYWFIIAAVSAHEKAMREQAKKMNVKSLRSSEDAEKSAEGKLAKVALVTISLWFMAWTPYLVINCMGLFKFEGLTPLNTIWGACFAKSAACYNPIVYGISHPKYRLALKEKCPCCVFGKVDDGKSSDAQSTATASEAESKA
ncbi:PREDICTED: opsin Rh1 [Drosophila arizonae]|uniref:Opsin Rh1 n=1 Tax=Drosophila arizonae TaxID=7263 RepID=A0ABM1PA67_DROAR|nr:PREDICTED: opsin Rh1 [Drosophila arizonae]